MQRRASENPSVVGNYIIIRGTDEPPLARSCVRKPIFCLQKAIDLALATKNGEKSNSLRCEFSRFEVSGELLLFDHGNALRISISLAYLHESADFWG